MQSFKKALITILQNANTAQEGSLLGSDLHLLEWFKTDEEDNLSDFLPTVDLEGLGRKGS